MRNGDAGAAGKNSRETRGDKYTLGHYFPPKKALAINFDARRMSKVKPENVKRLLIGGFVVGRSLALAEGFNFVIYAFRPKAASRAAAFAKRLPRSGLR